MIRRHDPGWSTRGSIKAAASPPPNTSPHRPKTFLPVTIRSARSYHNETSWKNRLAASFTLAQLHATRPRSTGHLESVPSHGDSARSTCRAHTDARRPTGARIHWQFGDQAIASSTRLKLAAPESSLTDLVPSAAMANSLETDRRSVCRTRALISG